MVYGIYLVLDQSQWYRNDFSSDNKLTGTIYTNKSLTVKKNLTGYTITIRMNKDGNVGERFGKVADIVSAAGGTFSYAVADGDMPFTNIYRVKVELTKAGVKETTLNRVDFNIIGGPST